MTQKVEEVGIPDGCPGKVDGAAGDRCRVLYLPPFRQCAENAKDDPAIDQFNEAKALGGRQKARGRHKRAILAVHADQDLEVYARSGSRERHDLLRKQTESILVERISNALNPIHFPDAAA